jgi:hypothetical protein
MIFYLPLYALAEIIPFWIVYILKQGLSKSLLFNFVNYSDSSLSRIFLSADSNSSDAFCRCCPANRGKQ